MDKFNEHNLAQALLFGLQHGPEKYDLDEMAVRASLVIPLGRVIAPHWPELMIEIAQELGLSEEVAYDMFARAENESD